MSTKKMFLAAILFPLWGLGGLHAQSVIDFGYCGANAGGGTNLTWMLYSDSTLVIDGYGYMMDYRSVVGIYNPPWENYRSQIQAIIIGNNITNIGYGAFLNYGSLTYIIIGNNVRIIGGYAFYQCKGLTSITIPNSVTDIGRESFGLCSNLSSLTIHAITPPTLNTMYDGVFYNVPDTISVYVPCESIQAYRDSAGWNYFSNYIGFMDTTFIYDTVCPNTVYNSNGFNVPAIAGTYYDTLQNTNGCDSIIELNLVVHAPSVPTVISASICQGDIYSDSNFTDLTLSGTYYDTLKNINGCDSVIELILTINPAFFYAYIDTIYCGEVYNDNNFTNLTQTGIYYDTLQATNSCDSIIELTLTVIGVGIVEASYELQVTSYEIYDMLGRKAPFNSPEGGKYSPPWKLSVAEVSEGLGEALPAGIYILRIKTNQGIIIKKLITLNK